MLAFGFGEHHAGGDPVEHVGGRRAPATLFQPSIPGRADIGALRHLLAAQAGGAASSGGKAERRRIEPRPAIAQETAEHVGGIERHRDPVRAILLIVIP